MAQPGEDLDPQRVVAARMRVLRKRRGWSAQALADEMTKVGLRWDRSIVTNIELGRRATVSVQELLALAYVLDVAPVHLMVPTDVPDDYAVYRVIPAGREPDFPDVVREWIRGQEPLNDAGRRLFFSEIPVGEEWGAEVWARMPPDWKHSYRTERDLPPDWRPEGAPPDPDPDVAYKPSARRRGAKAFREQAVALRDQLIAMYPPERDDNDAGR